MYKLLALDLDDTLLMKDLSIPGKLTADIERLISRGVVVTLATGRMMASAQRYAEQLKLTAPLVIYNGACLQKAGSPEACERHTLPDALSAQIIRLFEENKWYLQLFDNNRIVVNHRTTETDMDPDSKYAAVVEAGDLRKIQCTNIPKMMSFGTPSDLDTRQRILSELFGRDISLVRTKPFLLEIMPCGVSKANGLQTLCDMFGISKSHAVVCGDSDNDAEMLRWAGLGCCMANGSPAAKLAADYITQAERSFGVLEVIEKFFL